MGSGEGKHPGQQPHQTHTEWGEVVSKEKIVGKQLNVYLRGLISNKENIITVHLTLQCSILQ